MSDPPGLKYIQDEDKLAHSVCSNRSGTGTCECPEGRCWYTEQKMRRADGEKAIELQSWHQSVVPVKSLLRPPADNTKPSRFTTEQLQKMLVEWVDGKALVVELIAARQEIGSLREELDKMRKQLKLILGIGEEE